MSDGILYEIAMTLLPGIGDISGKKFVQYCGSAEAVFKETRKSLEKISGMREASIEAICKPKEYLKRAEDISDMLSLLGAAKAMMAFENVRVKKEVSNRVNRQLNCDNSNINRSMNAAETQIRDIRYIDSELGLDKLPRTLRDMAYTRANNPEIPLAELGELMDPPLGKSGVNARLRRISAIAEKLRCGDEVKL